MTTTDSLSIIKNHIRDARHKAYSGVYDDSIKAFGKALESIRTHYRGLNDRSLVDEWKKTENEVFAEMGVVTNLRSIVIGFKSDPGNLPISNPTPRLCEMRDEAEEEKPAKRFPFDRKPFSHHNEMAIERPVVVNRRQEGRENFDQGHFADRSQDKSPKREKPNFVYIREAQPKFEPPRDPEVWPSPSRDERFNRIVKPKTKPAKKVEKRNPYSTSSNNQQNFKKEVEKGRNYPKPWQVPLPVLPKQVSGASNGKKSYLDYCYQEGEKGPDEGLIQMIEKDVLDLNPNVKWDDIADLEAAKHVLQEAVLLPILCPEFFIGIRRPWSGVLMFGPPGTGKTMLAKALATQGKTTFFNITASSFASKWRGESERLVRILFEMARFYAPSTIFIDEIDALGGARGGAGEHESSRRVLSELLIQMDGLHSASSAGANEETPEEQRKTITVIAATNRPWDLDEALRRRLEKRIYIPLPNENGRKELFRINMRSIKIADGIDFDHLVEHTNGYSGADIATVCREASMMPLRRKILMGGGLMNQLNDIDKLKSEIDVPISMEDFLSALKNVHKSVSNNDLARFDKWMQEFGSK